MKITVEVDFKDGVASLYVATEERKEYQASMGNKDSEFLDESFEWACATAGVYVKGLLSNSNPHKRDATA